MNWVLILMVSTFWGNIERHEIGRFDSQKTCQIEADRAAKGEFGSSGYKKWICVQGSNQ